MEQGLAILYGFALVCLLPGFIAWGIRKVVRTPSLIVSGLVILVAAALPNGWIFYGSQDADSITRAAGVVVVPVLFVLSLIPAWIGERIGITAEVK